MNKKILTVIIIIFLTSTVQLAVAQTDNEPVYIEESSDAESKNLIGATFILGFIIDPEENRLKTNAKAVFLFYYQPGIIFKDRGIVTGLRNVQFRAGRLLYMNEPNRLGIVFVAGLVTGFKTGK